MPLVSVIIPSYNAAHYLPATLQSCLDQTHSDLEIIVVDDGSSDATAEIMRAYPQVQYLRQANAGPAAARNRGIAHATGDYLQFLDADDWLLPTKIERCLSMFQSDPQAGLVYCDYDIRSADMLTLATVAKPTVVKGEGQVLELLVNTTSTLFSPPCALVKSSLVRQVDGFTPGFNGVEDWHFWVKLAAIGTPFRYLDEVLVWYRHSPSSLSRNPLLMARSRLQAMQALKDLRLPSHLNLDEKIAGRHHALAMLLWEQGQKAEARTEFYAAIHTHPKGQQVRWLLYYASYLARAHQVDRVLNGLLWLKQQGRGFVSKAIIKPRAERG